MTPILTFSSQTIPRGTPEKGLPRGRSLVLILCVLSVLNWILPYLCSLALKPIFHLIPPDIDSGSAPLLINITIQTLAITGLTLFGLRISGLKLNDIGFSHRPNLLKYILGGIAAGAVYAIFIKFTDYHPAVWAKGGSGILTAARIAIITPFLEELFCRGLIFRLLEQEVSPRINIFITAVIYALTHYHFIYFMGFIGIVGPATNPITWVAISTYFVLGILCALIRHRSKSLWPAISVHASYNLILFLL